MAAAVLDIPITLRAVLAEPVASMGALVRLAPGDTLPIIVDETIALLAGKHRIASGTLGEARGMTALKLTRIDAGTSPQARGRA